MKIAVCGCWLWTMGYWPPGTSPALWAPPGYPVLLPPGGLEYFASAAARPSHPAPPLHARERGIILYPTSAAPVIAHGSAVLPTTAGAGPTILSLKMQGLDPGFYQIGVVTRPRGAYVLLGLLDLSNPTAQPNVQAGGDPFNQRSLTYRSQFLSTQTQAALPPGLPPGDVAQVVVATPGGIIVLTGPQRGPFDG